MKMISKWQVNFIRGLLKLNAVVTNDRWTNFVTHRLCTLIKHSDAPLSVRQKHDIDFIVGLLPFRSALLVVISLNEKHDFDPSGLHNISAVATRMIQLYRLTEAFGGDRLMLLKTALDSYSKGKQSNE